MPRYKYEFDTGVTVEVFCQLCVPKNGHSIDLTIVPTRSDKGWRKKFMIEHLQFHHAVITADLHVDEKRSEAQFLDYSRGEYDNSSKTMWLDDNGHDAFISIWHSWRVKVKVKVAD